jgi:hypothetical protein
VVRETVPHKAQFAFLDVLLDGVEGLFLADLHLCVCPARNLDDHVEDTEVLVGEERNIVPRGDGDAILLDEDTVFCAIELVDGECDGAAIN